MRLQKTKIQQQSRYYLPVDRMLSAQVRMQGRGTERPLHFALKYGGATSILQIITAILLKRRSCSIFRLFREKI